MLGCAVPVDPGGQSRVAWQFEIATVDAKTLIGLAFTTGLFTAILNQALAWLREIYERRISHKNSAKNFAIGLVEILTAYAQECNSRISYNRFDEQDRGYGRYRHLPTLPNYPTGPIELLPPKIAAGLVDLRNEISEAERDIESTEEVDGPPEAIDVATHRCATVGFRAYKLSVRLRRYYGLGSYQGQSDFASELRRYYRKRHHGPLRRLWSSLPMYRVRRAVSRWQRRVLRLWR